MRLCVCWVLSCVYRYLYLVSNKRSLCFMHIPHIRSTTIAADWCRTCRTRKTWWPYNFTCIFFVRIPRIQRSRAHNITRIFCANNHTHDPCGERSCTFAPKRVSLHRAPHPRSHPKTIYLGIRCVLFTVVREMPLLPVRMCMGLRCQLFVCVFGYWLLKRGASENSVALHPYLCRRHICCHARLLRICTAHPTSAYACTAHITSGYAYTARTTSAYAAHPTSAYAHRTYNKCFRLYRTYNTALTRIPHIQQDLTHTASAYAHTAHTASAYTPHTQQALTHTAHTTSAYTYTARTTSTYNNNNNDDVH
ncbi:unnamed protein product [Laminaria digitata]